LLKRCQLRIEWLAFAVPVLLPFIASAPFAQDEDLLVQHYPYLRGGKDIYSCADEHKVGLILLSIKPLVLVFGDIALSASSKQCPRFLGSQRPRLPSSSCPHFMLSAAQHARAP
jgi:hypothetical protein